MQASVFFCLGDQSSRLKIVGFKMKLGSLEDNLQNTFKKTFERMFHVVD